MHADTTKLWPLGEAANYLGITPKTLRKQVHRLNIPTIKDSRDKRVRLLSDTQVKKLREEMMHDKGHQPKQGATTPSSMSEPSTALIQSVLQLVEGTASKEDIISLMEASLRLREQELNTRIEKFQASLDDLRHEIREMLDQAIDEGKLNSAKIQEMEDEIGHSNKQAVGV